MAAGYGYGNARLRAMRSRLLTEADYRSLLGRRHIEEVISSLNETPYQEDIEAALVRTSGVRCVFEALRTNLTRTLGKIPKFYEGEPRALVELLLRRWDRHNLLTILRGQRQEIPAGTVLASIVPVGLLDEVSLRELARQPSLRAAIDLMTVWRLPYADALHRVHPRTGSAPDLDRIELALNRFHYRALRQALDQDNSNRALVLEQIQTEIDLINLSTTLRLVRRPEVVSLVQQRYDGEDVSPLFIPGGHLKIPWLVRQIDELESLEALVRRFGDTRYGEALEVGWTRYQLGEGGVALLERELERWQASQAATLLLADPLSMAIPIGYIECKRTETANLRLIAQAVALDMARDQVRRDLILVA